MTTVLDLTPDQLLQTTRAVRKRLDLSRPVEREVLRECVELATQAPTGRNRQRWEFVFVTEPDTRRRIGDLYRRGLTHPRDSVPFDGVDHSDDLGRTRMADSARHLFEHIHEVPVLLIPCVHVAREQSPSVVAQANGWGSIIPAVWSFMLAARARGIGTAWTTPHLHYEREAAGILGIPFDTVMQTALIPVAYTLGTDFRPAPRTDTDTVLHWNHW